MKSKALVVNGKTFDSIRDAGRFFNMNPQTIGYRLRRGWSLSTALGLTDFVESDKCNGIVYLISNDVNNKKYVGVTTRSLSSRWLAHLRDSKNFRHRKFAKAIRLIGAQAFSIKVIARTNSRKELTELENYYIQKYNSVEAGYNSTYSGRLSVASGITVTFEGKRYQSQAALAEAIKMPAATVSYRLKNGIPLTKRFNKRKWPIVYAGKSYGSLKAFMLSLDVQSKYLAYAIIDGKKKRHSVVRKWTRFKSVVTEA